MAAVPAGAPALPPAKIELPEDDGKGNSVGTRVVETAYRFNDNDQIGEGTYGKVYVGYDKKTDKKVALKMIRMDTEKEGFPITAIREIKILSSLHHENIVNLREIVRSKVSRESNYKGAIYMVFDYAEHDLTGLLERTKYKISASQMGQQSVPVGQCHPTPYNFITPFTAPQAKCILKQLLRGLSYCHINGILHRDLKASNLLIDSGGILKIADFGLARPFQSQQDGKLTNRVITLWYRPPELLLGADKYGAEVDMWSVGCIFAELLAAKPIFPGKDEQDQIHQIFSLMGAPAEANWPGVSNLEFFKQLRTEAWRNDDRNFINWCRKHRIDDVAADLLRKMLTLDPKKRITAPDAQMHPWFTTDPREGEPEDLPKVADSHEWTMKNLGQKRRHEERAAAAARGPQQQQQQQGGPGMHQSGAPHHAAHVAGGDRNVRQRQGGGGFSAGAAGGHAGGGHAGQQGYPGAGRGGYAGAPQRTQFPVGQQVAHGGARGPGYGAPAAGPVMGGAPGYHVQQGAPGYVGGGGYGSASHARVPPPNFAGHAAAPPPGSGGGYGGHAGGRNAAYGAPGQHQLPPQPLPGQRAPQLPAGPGFRPAQQQQQPGYNAGQRR